MKRRPDIFNYIDFRKYLEDCYHWYKSENRNFSHRYIAQKVRASSTGWFAGIITGKINLTPLYHGKLAEVFRLDGFEKEYFSALVDYNQAGSSDDEHKCLKKLLSLARIKSTVVGKDKFEFYSTWYIPAIREMLFFHEFSDDYAALAAKLQPPITIDEAKRGVKVLLSLGLLKQNANGFLKPCDPIVKKDSTVKSLHWQLYMRSNLELSAQALRRYGKKARDISACTVSYSDEGFSLAQEKIEELRKSLLMISEEDRKRHKVYQCNIQLFPLTQ